MTANAPDVVGAELMADRRPDEDELEFADPGDLRNPVLVRRTVLLEGWELAVACGVALVKVRVKNCLPSRVHVETIMLADIGSGNGAALSAAGAGLKRLSDCGEISTSTLTS